MLRSTLFNIPFLIFLLMPLSCAQKAKKKTHNSHSRGTAATHSKDAEKADNGMTTPDNGMTTPDKKKATKEAMGKTFDESKGKAQLPKVHFIHEARIGNQISRTFLSSKIEKAELKVSGNKKRIDSEITLKGEFVENCDILKQVTRVSVTDRFDQGLPETLIVDQFNVEEAYGSIDLMVVIDNSRSMRQEQMGLSSKLSALLSHINHSDWQIGIITTDRRLQDLRDLIRKGDAYANESFANAINAGTSGAMREHGLLMAQNGLKATIGGKPWVRQNSVIAVLIVSDEDNCSKGCRTDAAGRVGTLKAYLNSIRAANEARIYGIIDIPKANGRKSCASSLRTGLNYKKAIDSTGGLYGSICASSYTPTLEAISQNIKTILKKEFILSEIPVSTVKVFVNNAPWSDFTLNGKALKLTKEPASNATIRVEYLTAPSSMKSEFRLSKSNFLNDSFSVTVNGNKLAKDDYRIEANNIILATEPEAKAVIKVSYLLDDPVLTNDFTLSDTPFDPNAITVTVNDKRNTDFSYDNSQNMIVFTNTPADSAVINIAYQIKGAPILEYDISGLVKTQNFIGVFDKATDGRIEGIKLNDKKILTIPESAFSDGKEIIVQTEVMENSQNITLPVVPIENSVAVISSSCGKDVKFSIENKTINIKNCDIKEEGDIVFEYSYESDKKMEFSIAKMVPADLKDFSLDVFVNDNETENYILKDKVIKLNKKLAPETKVKIVVSYYHD